MRTDAAKTIEDRIRAIEDRLEIYNLIASHPPSADTGAQSYIQSIFTEDAVLDLGGAKTATGNRAISEMPQRPAHQEAIKAGLAHFAGLPHVTIDGDRAVVTSYLQILAPHPTADEVEVPAHGVARGYRIHRVGANRWELVRTPQGWKIKRRAYRTLDGSEPALDILRQALAPSLPGAKTANV
jgi:SnoaL-like domain